MSGLFSTLQNCLVGFWDYLIAREPEIHELDPDFLNFSPVHVKKKSCSQPAESIEKIEKYESLELGRFQIKEVGVGFPCNWVRNKRRRRFEISYRAKDYGLYEVRNDLEFWLDFELDEKPGLKDVLDLFVNGEREDLGFRYPNPEWWRVHVVQLSEDDYEVQYLKKDESYSLGEYVLTRAVC